MHSLHNSKCYVIQINKYMCLHAGVNTQCLKLTRGYSWDTKPQEPHTLAEAWLAPAHV